MMVIISRGPGQHPDASVGSTVKGEGYINTCTYTHLYFWEAKKPPRQMSSYPSAVAVVQEEGLYAHANGSIS